MLDKCKKDLDECIYLLTDLDKDKMNNETYRVLMSYKKEIERCKLLLEGAKNLSKHKTKYIVARIESNTSKVLQYSSHIKSLKKETVA